VLLHEVQGVTAPALDVAAGRVVWVDSAGGDVWAVRSIGLDGADPQLLGELLVRVTDVAADAKAIYLATSHNGDESLFRLPLGGGAPSPLVTGETRISWLVQDADYLYYVGHDGV
jgi:hypothetical protein